MNDYTVTAAIESAVTSAMERAGFSIQRTTAKTVVWRKDLVGSYLLISFDDNRLYGPPEIKRWRLSHVEDDPSPDARVRLEFDLNLLGALDAAKAIERESGTSSQTGHA